jgi:UDP-N-acetyl-D-galactosamine dehydrogenase
VLGITFKENCPDIRNSKVIDVINELKSYGTDVEVYDPQADAEEVKHEYGISLLSAPGKNYSAVVLAVSHKEFASINWSAIRTDKTVVYDVKGFLDKKEISARL